MSQALIKLPNIYLNKKDGGLVYVYKRAEEGKKVNVAFAALFGLSSIFIALTFCAIGGIGLLPSLAIMGATAGLVGGGNFVYNERARKKILETPDHRQLFLLDRAIDAYNREVDNFNNCVNALHSGSREVSEAELIIAREALISNYEELKRIVMERDVKCFPDTKSVERNLMLLRSSQAQSLSVSDGQKLLPPSSEYQEAIKELDEEFPT